MASTAYASAVSEYVRDEQQTVVVQVKTQAEADLLRVTLVANGIDAFVSPSSYIPSVDWVQGLQVAVRSEDAEAARSLLRGLKLI